MATLLGVTAGATAAAGAPAAATAAATALSAKAVAASSGKIIAALFDWMRKRQAEWIEILPGRIQQRFPDRTLAEIDPYVREEVAREREFQRKMRDRLERDIPKALANADPAERMAAVQRVLDRERRYTVAREEAVAERSFTRMEMIDLERVSPLGAFWKLSDAVSEHTVGCLALGNKFWPWTVLHIVHPQLHAGCACHLYTLSEAVERGWMLPGEVPDKADAERRAKDLIDKVHDVYEAVSDEEVGTWLTLLEEGLEGDELEEVARYGMKRAERFAAGTVKGGQFRPRRGAAPGRPTLRGKARRLLHRVIPEVPKVPTLRTVGPDAGTWHWISGKFTHVPTERAWEADIGGNHWESPAGSGNLYRNGYLVHVPGRKPPHHNDLDKPAVADIRDIPSTPVWQGTAEKHDPKIEAAAQVRYNEMRATIEDRVQTAVKHEAAGFGPVEVGFDTAISNEVLTANGFTLDAVKSIDRPDTERGAAAMAVYTHSKGMVLHVISDKGKVLDFTWETGLGQERTEFPAQVEDMADLKRALKAWAQERADLLDRGTIQLHEIREGDPLDHPDHSGSYRRIPGEPGAEIHYGTDTAKALDTWFAAKKEGRTLTPFEAGDLAAGLHAWVHEGLHAADPIPYGDYAYPEMLAWEESLHDEMARVEAPAFMQRIGATEALQFLADYPANPYARGAYTWYRGALDHLLDDAGVAPEEREDTIRMLRFEVPRHQRSRWIAERIVQRAGPDFYPQYTERGVLGPDEPPRTPDEILDNAEEGVTRQMIAAGDRQKEYFRGRFNPLLTPDLPDAHPPEVNGRPLFPGTVVEVGTDTDEMGNTITRRGRVSTVHPTPYDGIPVVVEVEYDDGGLDTAVLAAEIEHVESVQPSITIGGVPVSVGDVVSYDGRLDGGMSEALVTQVENGPNNTKVAHAVTTEASLRPGTKVRLTHERVGGKIEVVHERPAPEPAAMTREEFDAVNPSYEWKTGATTTEAGARFDALPDDQEVWLYHATSDEATARAMAADGIDPAGKPRSLARERFEAGEPAVYQPGAGLGDGTYVSYDPREASGYGRWMVAVKVRKGDVVVSPEQEALGETSPGRSLFVGDAMVRAPIPPEKIRLIGDAARGVPIRDQRIPKHPHEEFVKAAGVRSSGIDSIPTAQRVYIAEGAMERGGMAGGMVGGDSLLEIGHQNSPTEEGRAAAERVSKLAQEISGDPTLRAMVTDQPVWGAGANVIAAYDKSSHRVAIRPDATWLSFLHEIAHGMTRSQHWDADGHGPEFLAAATKLYRERLGEEAAATFERLATPPPPRPVDVPRYTFRLPPGVSSEIDMLESLDDVRSEEDIQHFIAEWTGDRPRPGVENFIRAWKGAEVRPDRSRSITLDADGTRFFDRFILGNVMDIWDDNASTGYETAKHMGYLRGGANVQRKIREALSTEVRSVGIDTGRDDQEEFDLLVAGDHPRAYFGMSTPERAAENGWSQPEILQVAREYGDALDDYEELLDRPEFHRLMRWTGDDGLAEIARSGWHRDRSNPRLPKRVGMTLLGDGSADRDGWGVTSTGGATARVDSRRPGVRTADSPDAITGSEWMADPRYTAIHEAHHMHGSNSEFDAGSEVAFAYYVNKRGLTGSGPDSIRSEIVNRLMRGTGVNSRPSKAIRAIFGDDLLDEWAQLPNSIYRDPFRRRVPEPVDNSIQGRVNDLNALDATPSEKRAWLEQRHMIPATEFYAGRVEAGETVWMRPNGESLALDSDGRARVLDDYSAASLEAVRSEGIDPLRSALQAAGFRSEDEAFQETELLARWPQYRDMPDQEILEVQGRLASRLDRYRTYRKEALRNGDAPSAAETEEFEGASARYEAVNRVIGARRASARHAREQEALRLADERGVPVIDRQDFIEMLGNAGDVYVDAGRKPPFDYAPEFFITSDLSGAQIRHYVTLPDGRKAHPDELHDARRRGRLVVVDNIKTPTDRPQYRSLSLPESVLAHLVPETHRVLSSGGVDDQEVGMVGDGKDHLRLQLENVRREIALAERSRPRDVAGADSAEPAKRAARWREKEAKLLAQINSGPYSEGDKVLLPSDRHATVVSVGDGVNPPVTLRVEGEDGTTELPAHTLRWSDPARIDVLRSEGIDQGDTLPVLPETGPIKVRAVNQGRGGPRGVEFTADLEVEGVIVGRVEKGLSQGGAGNDLYKARIGGTVVASEKPLSAMLRDARSEESRPELIDALDDLRQRRADDAMFSSGIDTGGFDDPVVETNAPAEVLEAYDARAAVRQAEVEQSNLRDFDKGDDEQSDAYRAAGQKVAEAQVELAKLESAVGGRVFRLNDTQHAKAEVKLKALGKRATKLKLDPPTMKVVGEQWTPTRPKGSGVDPAFSMEDWTPTHWSTWPRVHHQYVVVEGEEPKLAGWEFVATLQHLGGVNVIRRVPGSDENEVNLEKYRSGDATCDYCKTKRDRKDTFIVKNDDGTVKQIGRSCIKDFLGHGDPTQIAGYLENWADLDNLDDGDFDEEGGGGGGGMGRPGTEEYLAWVVKTVNEKGWASRSSGMPATADEAYGDWVAYVRPSRETPPIPPSEADYKRAREVLAWLRTDLASQERLSDFDHNMVAMSAGEVVPEKGAGILAYTVVAHGKAMEREIERKVRDSTRADEAASSNHVGNVGDRLDLALTVANVFPKEGDYGTTYITKLLDGDGNVFKWFGSYEMTQGATYSGKWGVKDHGEFKGVKETQLTRPTKVEMTRDAEGNEGIPAGWEFVKSSELQPGDSVLGLYVGKKGVEYRLAQPGDNALEGQGLTVRPRDDGSLYVWASGEELELPDQVARPVREAERTLDGKTYSEWEAERAAHLAEFQEKLTAGMTDEEQAAMIERGAAIMAKMREIQIGGGDTLRSEGIDLPVPVDTKQQQAILRQNKTAQKVRERFGTGTRVIVVRGVGVEPTPDAQHGVVLRHIPSTNAQGGSLKVRWDSGVEGVVNPSSVVREEGPVRSAGIDLPVIRVEAWDGSSVETTDYLEAIRAGARLWDGAVAARAQGKGVNFYVDGRLARTVNDRSMLADTLRSEGIERPFVDPNTIPVQTDLGPVTFRSGGDQIGPEYHATYVAVAPDGTNVGSISVAYLDDTAAVKMIEVPPEHRRKGVASALIQRVRNEQPGVGIETLGDVATPEGAAFIAAGRQRSRTVLRSSGIDTGDLEVKDGKGSLAGLKVKWSMLGGVPAMPQTIRYLTADTPDGERVGSLQYHVDKDGVWIEGISVKPEYRGRGIAYGLLREQHERTGLPIIHGFFSSLNGIEFGVTLAAGEPSWNKLWMEHDANGPVFWKPGTPVTDFDFAGYAAKGFPADGERPPRTFGPLNFDYYGRANETVERALAKAEGRTDPGVVRSGGIDDGVSPEMKALDDLTSGDTEPDVPPVRAPLPESPPTFKSLAPGLWESPDGRMELMKLTGANPPAWNVTWTTDYYNELVERDPEGFDYRAFGDLLVDGAASKKDALELLARDWPRVQAEVARMEAPPRPSTAVSDDPDLLFSAGIDSPPGNVASWVRTPGFVAAEPGEMVGIRAQSGDNDGVSETLGDQLGGRGTGHFGTGVYFGSSAGVLHTDRERSVGVPLLGKNLYKPADEREAFALHDALRWVNEFVGQDDPEADGWQITRSLGTVKTLRSQMVNVPAYGGSGGHLGAYVDLDERERLAQESILAAQADMREGRLDRDSASTRLMKRLGYDGVDTRHIPRLDNTEYGSVLYREDVVPPPLTVESVLRSEGVEPPGRVTRAEIDSLLDLAEPNARGRVVGSITYTPKLKRPATAKGFETRGQLWIGPEFFKLDRGSREAYLVAEFSSQFGSVGSVGAYAPLVYPEENRDFSKVDRATVELALRHGFPVAGDVERWATGKTGAPPVTTPDIPPSVVEEDLALDAEFQAFIDKMREPGNMTPEQRMNMLDGFLTDSMKIGGPKMGFSRVEYRRQGDGEYQGTYRNYDTGVTVIANWGSGGIEAFRTATVPPEGTVAHKVIGVPSFTANAMLMDAGYFPGDFRDGNWSRWAHRDGSGLLVKTSRRGKLKVEAAYPEAPTADEVKDAAAQYVQYDEYGGLRVGVNFADTMDQRDDIDSGWVMDDFTADAGGNVYTYRHEGDGDKVAFRARVVDDLVAEIGRPSLDDPLEILDDDAYRAQLDARELERGRLAAQGPEGWAQSLVGLTREEMYKREEFQSSGGRPYFVFVEGASRGDGSALFINHDTGVSLLANFSSTGAILEASATQSAQSRQHPKLERLRALQEAGEWIDYNRFMLEPPVWQPYGDEGNWHRFVNTDTGESMLAKFDEQKAGSAAWDKYGLTDAYYEPTTPAGKLAGARASYLTADPINRIVPGTSIEEVRNLLAFGQTVNYRKGETVDEFSGTYGGHPGHRIRLAHETRRQMDGTAVSVITMVGFKPNDPLVGSLPESDTRVLSFEEWKAEGDMMIRAAEEAKKATARAADRALDGRREKLAKRESPVEVGEPGRQTISDIQALGFSLQSRRKVNYSKADYRKLLDTDERYASYSAESKDRMAQRPGSRGYSYVYRNGDGHTLRVVNSSQIPAGATWLGMPVSEVAGKGIISQVEWTPARQVARERVTGRVGAASVDEHVADGLGRADELGERYGADVDVPTIKHTSGKSNHSGHHEWNGTIVYGRQAWPSMQAVYAKQKSGEPLTTQEARNAWAAWSLSQHEINHAVNPLRSGQYGSGSPEVAMEESLTEEAAQPLTVEWFKSMGPTGEEVLSWVKTNPRADEVLGSYKRYRQQLAKAFDEAGVFEDERRDLIMRMKFQMSQPERFEYLGKRLAGMQGLEDEQGIRKVRGIMAPSRVGRYGGRAKGDFTGIIDISPDLEGIKRRVGEVMVENGVVGTGSSVVVQGMPSDDPLNLPRATEISTDGSQVRVYFGGETSWVDTDKVRIAPMRFGENASNRTRRQRADDPTVDQGDDVVLDNGKTGQVEELIPTTDHIDGHDLIRVAVDHDADEEGDDGSRLVFTYRAEQILARRDTPIRTFSDPTPFELGGETLYPGDRLIGTPVPLTGVPLTDIQAQVLGILAANPPEGSVIAPPDPTRWQGDRDREYEFTVTDYNYSPEGSSDPARYVTGIIRDPESGEPVALNFPLARARRLTRTRVTA